MSRNVCAPACFAGSTVTARIATARHHPSTESAALRLLRCLDEEGQAPTGRHVTVKAPGDVTIYTLNRSAAKSRQSKKLTISPLSSSRRRA